MRGAFDRWLGKPSTICLPRRMIQSETGCRSQTGRAWSARRRQSTAAVAQERYEPEEANDTPFQGSKGGKLYKHQRIQSSKAILYMSLRSGVSLIPQDLEIASTLRELQSQADVDSDDLFGKLEVDEPANKHNMVLWSEILQLRQRWHGRSGVEAVWNGLRRRNIDLPTEGREADILWRTFIHAGIIDKSHEATDNGSRLPLQLFDYAKDLCSRTGQHYPGLYKAFVGRWLRLSPHMARTWHKYLVRAELATSDDMVDVVADVMQAKDSTSAYMVFFWRCYRDAKRRDMYDIFIAQALKDEIPMQIALKYHKVFLAQGDAPSQAFFAHPGVQELFRLDGDMSLPMRTVKPTTPQPVESGGSVPLQPMVNRGSMSALVGDVHGIKPKELSDAFCARMFATRAFSVAWVIKGLALFGVDKLGPLAMREMAVRAGSLEQFCKEVEELKEVDISTGDAMFSRLVVKVAGEGSDELWQALLESDQHPEAYDDAHTQNELLASFLEQGKWAQAHLGLLTAALSEGRAPSRAWNRLSQHYMLSYDYPATVCTLQSMQSQGVRLTPYTMDLLRSHVLPPRHVGKRPLKGHGPGYFEPTEFVAKAYIYAAERDKPPRATQWVEVLKRLGMNHQWEPFERVVLHLLARPANSEDDDLWPEESDLQTLRLRTIFTQNMRKALFIWGFRSASVRDELRPPVNLKRDERLVGDNAVEAKPLRVERWAQGLPLLQRLRDAGFDFDHGGVRTVFVQRMWILFGPGYSTRAINHEARRNNQLSLAHYIRHANEVWEGLVDWVDPELLEHNNDARLLPAFFGKVYGTSMKRWEFADVQAWSDALSSGKEYVIEPKSTGGKEAAWMKSPLRKPYSGPSIPPHKRRPPPPPSPTLPAPQATPATNESIRTQPHPYPTHQSPSAHSPNSHPPPNPPDTPAPPPPDSPHSAPAPSASNKSAQLPSTYSPLPPDS